MTNTQTIDALDLNVTNTPPEVTVACAKGDEASKEVWRSVVALSTTDPGLAVETAQAMVRTHGSWLHPILHLYAAWAYLHLVPEMYARKPYLFNVSDLDEWKEKADKYAAEIAALEAVGRPVAFPTNAE